MINLDNCRYIVYGYKNVYHTHGHIHEAFYRALHLTGKDVRWLDHCDDIRSEDFSDCFVISEHSAALKNMPIRDDCFYVIHGLNNDAELSGKMSHIKNRLGWNVYHDYSHGQPEQWDQLGQPNFPSVEEYYQAMKNVPRDDSRNYQRMFLAEDTPFYPKERHMDFRWATDLIPSEIEKNKPGIVLGEAKTIYWVGTQWFVNQKELGEFKRACDENGINFVAVGAGQHGVVSIKENINLVRESYFAPAIVGSHHITEGYLPCRVMKNISYGRMGITNSTKVNHIFRGRLIYNPDCYRLFYDAKEKLQSLSIEKIHELMDYIAANHTYLNRLETIMIAAKIVMEDL